MIEILQIPGGMVPDVWGQALRHLAGPIEMTRGRYLPEDVLFFCANGQMQLWLVVDKDIIGAAVTEIAVYPRLKYMRVPFLGGEGITEWHNEINEAIEMFGRQFGCVGNEAVGRKGWAKVLNADYVSVFMVRDYTPAPTAVSEGVH